LPVKKKYGGCTTSFRKLTFTDQSQVLRDQRDRGRDLEGIIKQWFKFVKPNFEKVSFTSFFFFR